MTRQEIIDGIYGCEVDTGFENLIEDKVYELADHILAAFEAKEKPTAPASLVEFAKREIKIAREQGNGSSFQDGRIYAFEEVLSRYRPASQDIVIGEGTVEVTEEDIFIGDNSVVDWFNENRLKNGELIFRKYEEAK